MKKDIRPHPTLVGISADVDGNIYRGGNLSYGTLTKQGYKQHKINYVSRLGHRLICECFLGRELLTEEVVNHKNSKRADNRLGNLEIGTHIDNVRHSFRCGERKVTMPCMKVLKPQVSGEKNPMAKLTKDQVVEMIGMIFKGSTNDELGEKYGVHPRYVSLIRHKKRWKNVWNELSLQSSTTIPSGSSEESIGLCETETSLQMRDMI